MIVPPLRMRLAVALPLTFIVLATTEMWWTWQFREYWSPVSGIAVAGVVIVTACVAIRMLWFGSSSAPFAMALSGLCAFAMAVALPWLFPLVNATTEEPTLFERVRYPLGLATIGVCTVACVLLVRRSLRLARIP